MPFVFLGFMAATGDNEDQSWRLCFLVPLALHLISAALTMTGRDLPDGNFKELETSGAKQKSDSSVVAKVGASNINAWILTIIYAMSFGVELTVTNVASQYFHDYHGTTPAISGVIAATFGLMNLFARSLGGLTSDAANKRFGMRGRLCPCCHLAPCDRSARAVPLSLAPSSPLARSLSRLPFAPRSPPRVCRGALDLPDHRGCLLPADWRHHAQLHSTFAGPGCRTDHRLRQHLRRLDGVHRPQHHGHD